MHIYRVIIALVSMCVSSFPPITAHNIHTLEAYAQGDDIRRGGPWRGLGMRVGPQGAPSPLPPWGATTEVCAPEAVKSVPRKWSLT